MKTTQWGKTRQGRAMLPGGRTGEGGRRGLTGVEQRPKGGQGMNHTDMEGKNILETERMQRA